MNLPEIVDRDTWLRRLDEQVDRDKEYLRTGDALAAQRRRLPVVELPSLTVHGPDGDVPLVDVFDGRRQLISYHMMWHDGGADEEQCEGCTFMVSSFADLRYLHARDTTFAVIGQGPLAEMQPFFERRGWSMPLYSARGTALEETAVRPGRSFALNAYLRDDDRVFQTYSTAGRGTERAVQTWGLLDMTVLGRQETWEDSPAGWPQTPPYEWWPTAGSDRHCCH